MPSIFKKLFEFLLPMVDTLKLFTLWHATVRFFPPVNIESNSNNFDYLDTWFVLDYPDCQEQRYRTGYYDFFPNKIVSFIVHILTFNKSTRLIIFIFIPSLV